MRGKLLVAAVLAVALGMAGYKINLTVSASNIQKNTNKASQELKNLVNTPFVFPVSGAYNEELYQKQEQLKGINQIYGIIIEDRAALESLKNKYNLESSLEGQNLDYPDEFFKNNAIIAVFPEQGSSSVKYIFGKAEATDYLIDITIEQYLPEVSTADIVNRGFIIGFSKEKLYLEDKKLKPLNITQRTILPTMGKVDKSELTIEDLMLGNIRVQIAESQLNFVMNIVPNKSEKEQNGIVERRTYEGVEITLSENEVIRISSTSDRYPTPRGLKVGDRVDTLLDLYGEPSEIIETQNNTKIYSFDLSGEYYLFHAEVKDGKIIRLQVNLAC
jgi:hypothetical protein